jgi:UDP-glucose:(heptosyl)LPS alpha-1,3-glucosyltransferase
MIKLAIVRQRFNPYGGSERSVSRALSVLRSQGKVDVTLITRRSDEAVMWHALEIDPFYVTRTGRDRGFARAAVGRFSQFELVQSHERIPGAHVFRAGDGVHAAWLEQRDRVESKVTRFARRWGPYHRYVLAAEAAMFSHPALRCVICNSNSVAADIVRRFSVPREKIVLVCNGVDQILYHPALTRHREGWRQQNQIPLQVPLLAFLGSGFLRRGLATALSAIVDVPQLHLAVAGTDRHPQRYARMAERLGIAARVHFLGPMPNVRPLYGAADALILPSLYDPFPTVCMEALAAGLPLFTSPTCGASEWIRTGENGWVVDALDVAGYRNALVQWLDKRADWPAMRAAARKTAEPFTLERMVDELAAVYADLRRD